MDRYPTASETWHVHAARGLAIDNTPREPETLRAIEGLDRELIAPIEREFGLVEITYGFAGPALVKAVKARAAEGGWLPNIHPAGDKHAGHERNTRGTRVCKVDGFAVDLRVRGVSSFVVAEFVRRALPFDWMYLYAPERPFHLSWAREPAHGTLRMRPKKNGGLVPRVFRGAIA